MEPDNKPMRLRVLSDLHLDSGSLDLDPACADVVVLAGDIHEGHEAIGWIRTQFPQQHVVYVLGNHEFYHQSIPELAETVKQESKGSLIHILENDAVELDGVTFVGCTLWTDFNLCRNKEAAVIVAEQEMWDFSLIASQSGKRSFRPSQSAEFWAKSFAWLKSELGKRDPARTIVVTHHAPSHRSIAPGHAGSDLCAAFASDLDEFVKESGVPLWIHGHTHYNVDYRIGATRVYSNQRGYAGHVLPCFDPVGVIDV